MFKTTLTAVFLVLCLWMSPIHPIQAHIKPESAVVGASIWRLFDTADREGLHLSLESNQLTSFYDTRLIGLVVVADQGQRYYALGVSRDFWQFDNVKVGLATHIGFVDNDFRLGHEMEFFTKIYADYPLGNNDAVRVELGHISNGGTGERNPGSENLAISYVYNF